MPILRILLGTVMLVLGRKLYWFFVGVVGFVAGLNFAARFFSQQPEWVMLIIAVLAGLVGAVLALFLQRLAVGIAGFLAGGDILVSVLNITRFDSGPWFWVLFLVGGLIGFILVVALFDWALIVLSSVTGAQLVAQALPLPPMVTILTFVILLIIGIVVQVRIWQNEQVATPSTA